MLGIYNVYIIFSYVIITAAWIDGENIDSNEKFNKTVWDLEENSQINISKDTDDQISLTFHGSTEVYKAKKLRKGKKYKDSDWRAKHGIADTELNPCVFVGTNDDEELLILLQGCKHISGGKLMKNKYEFDLELGSDFSNSGKKGYGKYKVKVMKRTQKKDLKKLKDRKLKTNKKFQKGVDKYQEINLVGPYNRTARQTEQHIVQFGFIGDFSFYNTLQRNSMLTISEYMSVVLGIFVAGMERLPGLWAEISTVSHYTEPKLWMTNVDLNSDKYLSDMNTNAKQLFGDADVYVHITSLDFFGEDAIGWASELGDVCDGESIAGSVNEMGNNGPAGSLDDAVAVADIATHEAGHNLGFAHDFEIDNTRTPSICNDSAKQMGYQALNWLQTQLENSQQVWSSCSLSNWDNTIAGLRAREEYCFHDSSAEETQEEVDCGTCLKPHSKGCSNSTIEKCVCILDKYCCEEYWDNSCVNKAKIECGYNCKLPVGELMDCGTCNKTTTQPGCSNLSIENCVCAIDDFCCKAAWDTQCIDYVIGDCNVVCI